MKADDPSVDDDDTLYWRAPEIPKENWTTFDEGSGEHRVRTGAFVWNDDGVSCYRQMVLAGLGLNWTVVKDEPRNGILSVQVANARGCELGVAADPDPEYIAREQLRRRDRAHALIVIEDGTSRKKRDSRCRQLARTASIVHSGDR